MFFRTGKDGEVPFIFDMFLVFYVMQKSYQKADSLLYNYLPDLLYIVHTDIYSCDEYKEKVCLFVIIKTANKHIMEREDARKNLYRSLNDFIRETKGNQQDGKLSLMILYHSMIVTLKNVMGFKGMTMYGKDAGKLREIINSKMNGFNLTSYKIHFFKY